MAAIGALEPCASSTKRIIWDKVVSFPTWLTSTWNEPVVFNVAPTTLLPSFLKTGTLSPVIMDSSTKLSPEIITPSTGIFSPGRTKTTSPICNSSTGTSTSFPSRITVATFGDKATNDWIAWEVLPFVKVSKYFPTVIKAKMTAADST